MFYNARWYDPSLGRFAQADSIVPGGVQGLDRYGYVNNSPMNYVDPSGHEPKYGDGTCYEIDCKNANGTTPSLGNGKGGILPRSNCQNRTCSDFYPPDELAEFFNPVTLVKEMFSIDTTLSGAPSIGDLVEIGCNIASKGSNTASCSVAKIYVEVAVDAGGKTISTVINSSGPTADTNFRTPISTSPPMTSTLIPTLTITPTINTPTSTLTPTATLTQTPSATLTQTNTYTPSITPSYFIFTPTYPVYPSTPTYWPTP